MTSHGHPRSCLPKRLAAVLSWMTNIPERPRALTDIGAAARVDVQYAGSRCANQPTLPGTSERDPVQSLSACTLLNARLTFNNDNCATSLFAYNGLDQITRQWVQNS